MPLNLTYLLALFSYSSVNSGRVLLTLNALDLGASPSVVGLLFASYFVFPLALSWPVGKLSDRLGSRWLLLFGAVIGTGGMTIPFFVRSMPALFAAGLLVGLAFAFANVLIQNLVGVLSKPHERVKNFGNSSLVASTTGFVGPLVAGFAIDHSGHALACLYSSALAVVAVVLLLVWGKALPGAKRSSASTGSLRSTLVEPAILRILVTSSLVQVGQDLYQFYLPIYGHGIGLSASAIGSILATFAAAAFFVRFLMVKLVAWMGEENLLAVSMFLAAAGFILVPFFHNIVALSVISFIFGLGMGCGQPITTLLLFGRSPEGRSGEILGLRQVANNLLRVLSPTVFGVIATTFGLIPVFGISAVMMGVGGVIARPRPKPGSDEEG